MLDINSIFHILWICFVQNLNTSAMDYSLYVDKIMLCYSTIIAWPVCNQRLIRATRHVLCVNGLDWQWTLNDHLIKRAYYKGHSSPKNYFLMQPFLAYAYQTCLIWKKGWHEAQNQLSPELNSLKIHNSMRFPLCCYSYNIKIVWCFLSFTTSAYVTWTSMIRVSMGQPS